MARFIFAVAFSFMVAGCAAAAERDTGAGPRDTGAEEADLADVGQEDVNMEDTALDARLEETDALSSGDAKIEQDSDTLDTGQTPDTTPDDTGCVPRKCADVGAECGPVPDGCGDFLDCGTCTNQPACQGTLTCTANKCVLASSPTSCDDGNSCTEDVCSSTGCTHSKWPDFWACKTATGASGTCHSGSCCAGCWAADGCHDGTEAAFCWPGGAAGANCVDCRDTNPCTADACYPGAGGSLACGHTAAVPAQTPCTDNIGRTGWCVGTTCTPTGTVDGAPCTTAGTCNSGLACVSGTCKTCGGAGQPCCPGSTKCSNSGLACNSATSKCEACGGSNQICCGGNTCKVGWSCTSGKCHCGNPGEACCTTGTPCAKTECWSGVCGL